MEKMLFRISKEGRIERKRSRMFFSLTVSMIRATSAAKICPRTVATAAPVTPSLGKGPMPKIKSGSKMILKIAPAA